MSNKTKKLVELIAGKMDGLIVPANEDDKSITMASETTGQVLVYKIHHTGPDGMQRFWFAGYEKEEQ